MLLPFAGTPVPRTNEPMVDNASARMAAARSPDSLCRRPISLLSEAYIARTIGIISFRADIDAFWARSTSLNESSSAEAAMQRGV